MAFFTDSQEKKENNRHLENLLALAESHCSYSRWSSVEWLYRNKPQYYFDDIVNNRKSFMEKYLKDNGGDPKCPINGRLEGLFFGVTLFDGNLPPRSPYGDTRVIMPLQEAFDQRTNLFFSDFFCMRGYPDKHYVQLVLAKEGSGADMFCQKHLLSLDPVNNSFLRKSDCHYMTIAKYHVYLEVFYTENVDLTGRPLIKTGTIGQGHSSSGGIPKSAACNICNVIEHPLRALPGCSELASNEAGMGDS